MFLTLRGFNFVVVIFLINLLEFVLILIIFHFCCHMETPSIEDIAVLPLDPIPSGRLINLRDVYE